MGSPLYDQLKAPRKPRTKKAPPAAKANAPAAAAAKPAPAAEPQVTVPSTAPHAQA